MKYHVTYFYLATGMEGIADIEDYGIIEAESKDEAKDIVAKRRGTYEQYKDNKCYRHWGLSAKLIKEIE